MAETDSALYHYTYYLYGYWKDCQDPRTVNVPGATCMPYTIALIMYAYYALVTKIGPAYMKNRPPFQLRTPMFIYNCFMVFVNAYFFYEAISYSDYFRVFLNFDYPSVTQVDPEQDRKLRLGWWYWMSKFADWFDTFFYVLRKKDSHINFLHLYHHISVPVFGYLIVHINHTIPCAHLFIVINCFVHCCMYSYYALAALGPAVQKWLWWKRYITVMQLTQFGIGIVYGIFVFFLQTGYPKVWMAIGLTQPPFFYWMFYKFYQQAYMKEKQLKEQQATKLKSN